MTRKAIRESATSPLMRNTFRGGHYVNNTPSHGYTGLGNLPMEGSANARNVWTIPTKGYPGAHFATFPEELPRRCILAGTSAYGVCAECGAPWVRVVEHSIVSTRPKFAAKSPKQEAADASVKFSAQKYGGKVISQNQTLGWQPTCGCNACVVPAVVLDPFVGSGTTLAVAQSLGRHSIGLDLNPEYLALAAKRIGKVTLPLNLA